jgi:soluble lytic murein transglycosylase-like protein
VVHAATGVSPRTWWSIVSVVVILALASAAPFAFIRRSESPRITGTETGPADAPPDLAPLREPFLEGIEALQQAEGPKAVERLKSITFRGRDVEQYRLYFLANAHQLTGNQVEARRVLSELWSRRPRLVYWQDAGFTLASLYNAAGDWNRAADIYGTIATRSEHPAVSAVAQAEYIKAKFYAGDPGAILYAARNVVIESPRSPQSRESAAVVRALTGTEARQSLPLTPEERLTRATNLLRDGSPQDALTVLEGITPWSESSRLEIQLRKGIALHNLRRFEDSNRQLEPLTSGYYKYAIPALNYTSRNYRTLAASIDPTRTKTVTEKRKTGTRKVKRKGKTVRVPVYKNVKRTVKVVDLNDKKKKEEFERLRVERLKDLLTLPTETPLRSEVLLVLIGLATEKNQDDYLRELVTELVKIDPANDVALQRFWDKGWNAYLRGDHVTAQDNFLFIEQTYRNPNIRRQSRYWRARSMERTGKKQEAAEIYQDLATAPYEDLYARFAVSRGAKANRRAQERETRSWQEIADKEMPEELRLAYELNALGLAREARLEIQRNALPTNRRFADAILGDLYFHNGGSRHLAFEYMRKAFPDLATVEQDQVPSYFLDLYYPLQYENAIRANARKHDLDPHLVMGLIRQESGYDPEARSPVGATGLMQIMPATGRELSGRIRMIFTERRLTDPEDNIQLGTLYLRQLLNRFNGVPELAIASYNGGMGNVSKWRRGNQRPLDEFVESIPFPETRNYVKRVTMLSSTYRERKAPPPAVAASAR